MANARNFELVATIMSLVFFLSFFSLLFFFLSLSLSLFFVIVIHLLFR